MFLEVFDDEVRVVLPDATAAAVFDLVLEVVFDAVFEVLFFPFSTAFAVFEVTVLFAMIPPINIKSIGL